MGYGPLWVHGSAAYVDGAVSKSRQAIGLSECLSAMFHRKVVLAVVL